jgi:hypothetical protein
VRVVTLIPGYVSMDDWAWIYFKIAGHIYRAPIVMGYSPMSKIVGSGSIPTKFNLNWTCHNSQLEYIVHSTWKIVHEFNDS